MDKVLEKILYQLKANGLVDSEFAKRLGLSRSAVTDWKTGKTKSYMRYIPQISEIFNLSTEYFLDDNYLVFTQNTNLPGDQTNSDDTIKFALFGTTQIDDEVLDEVKRFAKYIKEKKDNGDKNDL